MAGTRGRGACRGENHKRSAGGEGESGTSMEGLGEKKAVREMEALHQKFREIEEEYRRRERRQEGTGNGS
jgi:hypothetical protein